MCQVSRNGKVQSGRLTKTKIVEGLLRYTPMTRSDSVAPSMCYLRYRFLLISQVYGAHDTK